MSGSLESILVIEASSGINTVTEASSEVDASILIGVLIGIPLSASTGTLRGSALVVGIFGAIAYRNRC
jgi:hypothetical protein